jgi:hypothetical protein
MPHRPPVQPIMSSMQNDEPPLTTPGESPKATIDVKTLNVGMGQQTSLMQTATDVWEGALTPRTSQDFVGPRIRDSHIAFFKASSLNVGVHRKSR